jgi:tetratricopeptide (TPR) repeat protein
MMNDGASKEREAFLARAEACLEQGLYQMAQDLAQDWLNRFPGDREAMVVACHAWTKMGRLDKVMEMLQEVDKQLFELSHIYARMGDICQRSGMSREAATFYRKFIVLNPDAPAHKEISKKLADLVGVTGDDILPEADADAEGEEVIVGFQTVTMAELYLKQGHLDMAENLLQEILSKDPGNEAASSHLKKVQSMLDDREEKMRSLRQRTAVIEVLARWLKNIDRMRSHAM